MDSKWKRALCYAGMLSVYITTYSLVSRADICTRGWGRGAFSYLPGNSHLYRQVGRDPTKGSDRIMSSLNRVLVVFYYPAWAVDYYILGGPHFVVSP
jgi:hypothetical protein